MVLRHPRPDDVEDLRNLINSLVKERADIAKTTPVTLREEKIWLDNVLKSIRNKDKILLVAELDDTVVGSCEITRDVYDVSRHVGTLGVGLAKNARGIGIGTSLIRATISEAKKIGIKLVKLYVFDSNNIGKNIYEEIGFVEIGRIPGGVYHNKKYKDDIIMVKRL